MQLKAWYGATPVLDDDHPKRLTADLSRVRSVDEYARWSEVEDTRRRFESSAWIAAHWPAELVRNVGLYFSAQAVLNWDFDEDTAKKLPLVEPFLNRTELRVPVLWLLGSDVPEQQILKRRLREAGASERLPPEYAYAIAVGKLADRRYAEAAALFSQAAETMPKEAGVLAAYAWCRAGRTKRAAAVPGADLLPAHLRCWTKR